MKNALLTLILFLCAAGYAQQVNFDKRMLRREPDCNDVAYNSRILFEKYYTGNDLDSAQMLLKYWKGKCGSGEIIQRLETLLSLKEGNLNTSLLPWNTLDMLLRYNSNRMGYGFFGYEARYREFDKFTEKQFEDLHSSYPSGSTESLLCESYSGNLDSVLLKLQATTIQPSVLSESYRSKVNHLLSKADFHASFLSGIWIPTGKLSTLGVQPEIGIQIGAKHKKMNYDLTLLFRPSGKSAHRYIARRTEDYEWELTNHFSGGYIGIDVGRDIFTCRRSEFQLAGGIAADVIEPFNEESESDPKTGAAWSYNFNLGLGYRYYAGQSWYLGVKARYNLVNYKLSHTIDFTGNPVTVQFSVGLLFNPDKYDDLKRLKYRFRK